MASFNSCTFSGRVGNDPEVRFLESGSAVAKFSLAVDRYGKKNGPKPAPLWLRVEVWGKRAQTIADHVKKGSAILVQGELGLDEWERDGKKNSSMTLNCSQFTFVGGDKPKGSAPSGSKGSRPEPEEEEIPF